MTGTTESFNDNPMPSQSGQGPGSLVRQAREKSGLSIEDLAAQIKLARGTLDAIERDDFAQLNEPVYVRGYYRKLSKVLPVAEGDLLDAYARIAGNKAPPHPSKLILAGGAELGSGNRISLKLSAAIILFGLLIGALAFWGKNRSSNNPTVSEVTPAAVTVDELAPTPVQDSVPAIPSPTVEEAALPATISPALTEEASAPPVQPLSANAPVAAVQIQFNGSSWTEVKDATGKVLLSGLVEAGSKQLLDGKAPFVVFLGNAPGVTIIYNGQPVDTAPFRRGDNTARVTLP